MGSTLSSNYNIINSDAYYYSTIHIFTIILSYLSYIYKIKIKLIYIYIYIYNTSKYVVESF